MSEGRLANSPTAVSCRTLIVEDDRLSSAALRALLSNLGCTVACAASIRQALRELKEFDPQCVILDMMLPDGSGVSLLRHVRESGLPIKVAVVTAGNDERTLGEVRDLRADLIMRKPLDVAQLTAWVASASAPQQVTARGESASTR